MSFVGEGCSSEFENSMDLSGEANLLSFLSPDSFAMPPVVAANLREEVAFELMILLLFLPRWPRGILLILLPSTLPAPRSKPPIVMFCGKSDAELRNESEDTDAAGATTFKTITGCASTGAPPVVIGDGIAGAEATIDGLAVLLGCRGSLVGVLKFGVPKTFDRERSDFKETLCTFVGPFIGAVGLFADVERLRLLLLRAFDGESSNTCKNMPGFDNFRKERPIE